MKTCKPITISLEDRKNPFYSSKEYLSVLRKVFWLYARGEVIFTTYEEENKKYSADSFRPAVVVSDVFWYACSDAEGLRYDDLEKAIWAKEQLKVYGVIIWASLKRKLVPKGKIFRYTKDKTDFVNEIISYKKKFPDVDLSFLLNEKDEFKDTNPSVVDELYSLVAQDQRASSLPVQEVDIPYSLDTDEAIKEEILFLSTLFFLEEIEMLNIWGKEDYITSFSVEGLYENIDCWSYKDQINDLKEGHPQHKEISENKILGLIATYGIPGIYAWLTANNKTKKEVVLDKLFDQLQYEAATKFIENSYEAVSRSDTDE